ncbi:unnamed protein product, partial [Ectocarpus sp. 12 AP-2014]
LVGHLLPPPSNNRDIKPENVMMGRDGTPVLMDFGSVAAAERRVRGR